MTNSLKKKGFIDELNSAWIDRLLDQHQEQGATPQKKTKKHNISIGLNSTPSQIKQFESYSTKKSMEFESHQLIRKEIKNLKKILVDLNLQVQSHVHKNYEEEIQKIRIENNKIKTNTTELKEQKRRLLEKLAQA